VSEREPVVRFMDDLRAAEAAGVEVLDAWIAVCPLDGLRGGLRVIAEREARHALLLAERLAELGIAPAASVAGPVRAAALGCFGSRDVRDEQKLGTLLARYPDEAAVGAPLEAMAAQLHHDHESRELLWLIAASDRVSVTWLRAYQGR
jgi:hypothetical protein